jgi:integrase
MPAEQQGSVYKTSRGYGLRWYDETGARRRQAGFSLRSAARAWFRDVEQPRMRGEAVPRRPVTLREHVDRYLEVHAATRDSNTIRSLRERSKRPVAAFGDVQLRDLERMAGDLATWQTTLPERSRYAIMQALRQMLDAAVRWGDMECNPAKLAGANPPPPPRGVQTFTLAEIDKLAVELGPTYGPMIQFAAATGMRPEEWAALERQDVVRAAGVARVARTHVEGATKPYGKNSASVREVPLSARALAATTPYRHGWTLGSSSLGRAGTLISATSGGESGSQRWRLQVCRRGGSTTSAPRSLRTRWQRASRCSNSRGSWARACR